MSATTEILPFATDPGANVQEGETTMSATTEILPFATDPGANVQAQADYAADGARTDGFASGVAESAKLNKVWRQAAFMAAGLANFMVQKGISVPDDGDLDALVANMVSVIASNADLSGADGSAQVGFESEEQGYLRTVDDKLQEIERSFFDFGAIGDGNSHPLSQRYPTLLLAQAYYPHATDLDDEIDWCAIQLAINVSIADGRPHALNGRNGDFRVNKELVAQGPGGSTFQTNLRILGEFGGTDYGNTNATTCRIKYTGAVVDATKHVLSFITGTAGGAFSRHCALQYIDLDGNGAISCLKTDCSADFQAYNVGFFNAQNCITAVDKSYSMRIGLCEFHNFVNIGIDLQANCHNFSMSASKLYGDNAHRPLRQLRIGQNDHCSAVHVGSTDFECYGSTTVDGVDRVAIEAVEVRGLTIDASCYFEEPGGSNYTNFIRLGNTGAGKFVDGFSIAGNYLTSATNGPYWAANLDAIDVQHARGGTIEGNHFRNIGGQFANIASNCDDINVGPNYRDGTNASNTARYYLTTGGIVQKLERRSTYGAVTVGLKDGAQIYEIGTNANGGYFGNDQGAGFEMVAGAASAGTSNAAWRPMTDNAQRLGTSIRRVSEVYAGTATINTSDEREKANIGSIAANVLAAWGEIEFYQYQMTDSVARKGDGARWHFGVIAQRVKEVFEAHSIDPFSLGLLCFDEWSDEYEDILVEIQEPAMREVKDELGNLTRVEALDTDGKVIMTGSGRYEKQGTRLVQAAGNRYGIRYEEALALECAYLRSCLK